MRSIQTRLSGHCRLVRACCLLALVLICHGVSGVTTSAQELTFEPAVAQVQPKMVKIYGAGGYAQLETYQSGFFISSDGHILTTWSYVLDTDVITVILDDGRRFVAELLGRDPRIEIAVLKIEGNGFSFFNLDEAIDLSMGARVLAFSNLFGIATGNEPCSVLHGTIAAETKLTAGKAGYETLYKGNVYVVDAMTNNPGATGGALTDRHGRLAGLLGKELRNTQNGAWLNYAIPIRELSASIDGILAGRYIARIRDDGRKKPAESISLGLLGIVLVPDILDKTPPYIDRVLPDSPAEDAGFRADDLVLFINDQLVSSCKTLVEELEYLDRYDPIRISVQRDKQIIETSLYGRD